MSVFVRGSAKGAKPDPMYYVRKVNQLKRQRAKLHAREDELDPSGAVIDTPEGRHLAHKIRMLTDRIGYYLRLFPTACELYDRLKDRRTRSNPTGAVTYWPPDPWNDPTKPVWE